MVTSRYTFLPPISHLVITHTHSLTSHVLVIHTHHCSCCIVTSYSTLASEYANDDEEKPQKQSTGKGKNAASTALTSSSSSSSSSSMVQQQQGQGLKRKASTSSSSDGLLSVPWHRVVLDEAHTIRNTATKTFKVRHELYNPFLPSILPSFLPSSLKLCLPCFRFTVVTYIHTHFLSTSLPFFVTHVMQPSGGCVAHCILPLVPHRHPSPKHARRHPVVVPLPAGPSGPRQECLSTSRFQTHPTR